MTSGPSIVRGRTSERNADHAFLAVAWLLCAASTTLTIVWCAPWSAMGGMPMPGGWTLSMAWMRMPEQTWVGTATSWLGMWVVMMVAMMLPSLVPILWRYRESVIGAGETRPGLPTALVGLGYFGVWTLVGMIACPLGFALAAAEMRYPALSRSVPIGAGIIVLIAGAFQFTTWKSHHLACYRESGAVAREYPRERRRDLAWRHGVRLGLHCSYCSAGLTAILLVMGVMDLRVMAVVTAAITAERLAPAGERVARGIGVIVVCAGALLLARAAGPQ